MSEYVISDLPPPQAFLIFLAQRAIGKLEGTKGRERELVASEEFENLLYLLFSRGRLGTRQISDGASQTRMLELNRGRENDKSQSSSNAYASCMFVLSF